MRWVPRTFSALRSELGSWTRKVASWIAAVARPPSADRPTAPAATTPSPARPFRIVLRRSMLAGSSPCSVSALAGDVELQRNSQNPVFSFSVKGVPDSASGRSLRTQRRDVRCRNLVKKQHLRSTQQRDLCPSSEAILPKEMVDELSVVTTKVVSGRRDQHVCINEAERLKLGEPVP